MEIRPMFVVGIMLLGSAAAQQPAAPKNPPASPAKAQPTPATKLPEAPKSQGATAFATPKEKASYALGMYFGALLHRQGITADDVDLDVFQHGLKDSTGGGKTLLTEEEERATLQQWQTDMRAEVAAKNKKEGEAFLAANKTKEGIVSLPSGLQYKILTPGTGPKPAATDTVACNYRGTFINGTEFDSSAKTGKPVTFPLNGVIKGWTEALQLMPTGSKWQLFIPSDLAYGEPGRGPIPPNSTLVFEVELVSIQPPKAPEPPKASEQPKAPEQPKPNEPPKPPATPKP